MRVVTDTVTHKGYQTEFKIDNKLQSLVGNLLNLIRAVAAIQMVGIVCLVIMEAKAVHRLYKIIA